MFSLSKDKQTGIHPDKLENIIKDFFSKISKQGNSCYL